MTRETPHASNSLETYLSELSRYPLLTVDEEQQLARAFRDHGDTRAAHRLVTANLRFVVKVAYEYRSYGLKMPDLIQEGNIGLMKAVQKFDPEKGIRLISYAVWWIRAYIQNHVLRSWSLVKLGTTQAQRKLFFSLARTKRELDRISPGDTDAEDLEGKIAKKLRVRPSEVQEMSQRMNGRDFSLDAPMSEGSGETHLDFVPGSRPSQETELSTAQEEELVTSRVAQALERLDERERYIIQQRVMSENPATLKDLGEHFGFSRERARQLEIRAKAKLKAELEVLAADVGWPSSGQPVDGDERAVA